MPVCVAIFIAARPSVMIESEVSLKRMPMTPITTQESQETR